MATKSKKAPVKGKASIKDVKANRAAIMAKANQKPKSPMQEMAECAPPPLADPATSVGAGESARLVAAEEKLSAGPGKLDENEWASDPDAEPHLPDNDGGNTPEALDDEATSLEKRQNMGSPNPDAIVPTPPPPPLTLPLVADSFTLALRGASELTAQLLGTSESAVMLVRLNEWLDHLGKLKKMIVGNDDEISGLKKLVIETGQPWGEKGSKQLALAGAVVKVKAVNYRSETHQLSVADLDEEKVEAYLRGVPWQDPIEKVLACYMRPRTVWTLKDLPPQQAKNIDSMLRDPGEDGQGLRQCLKDTKYQMMAPEMDS